MVRKIRNKKDDRPIKLPSNYLDFTQKKRDKLLKKSVQKYGKDRVVNFVEHRNDLLQHFSPDIQLKEESAHETEYVKSLS